MKTEEIKTNFMQIRELTDEEWLKLPKKEILQLYKGEEEKMNDDDFRDMLLKQLSEIAQKTIKLTYSTASSDFIHAAMSLLSEQPQPEQKRKLNPDKDFSMND